MKAAYFIAQAKNTERYNAFFEREGVFLTPFSANDIPSLTAFITRDKAIVQQDYIVIDVGEVKTWSISHILSAVQHLRRFSSAQLIFIGEPCEDLTELYGSLANVHHIDCLITDDGNTDVDEELKKCLAGKSPLPDRMRAITQMLEQQTAQIVKPLNIPTGLVIHVALSGTMPRCGVTTQTFAIYHYLKSLGFHPAIWDKLGQLLQMLMRYEQFERKDSGIVTVQNIDFCAEQLPQYNAYIIDYGTLAPETAPLFCGADLSVLVGCTKPWELPAFAEAVKLLFGTPCEHLVTIASFATQGELDKLAKYLGSRTGAAPYLPDWWHGADDTTAYAQLLLPELKEICGEPAQRASPTMEVE